MTCNEDVRRLIAELQDESRMASTTLYARAATMLDAMLSELDRRQKLVTECQDIATILRHENERFRRILNTRGLPLLRNTAAANMDELVDLHNQHRVDASWLWKLGHLSEDERLTRYAQKHAYWMATYQKLKHSPMKDILQLGFSRAGENIAVGQKTPRTVMQSWLWSPGHRANIMSRMFNRIGCGAALDNKTTRLYWCVCFGRV